MIRAPSFGDIPRLVEVIRDTHAVSTYAMRAALDEKEAKRLLMMFIQRNGMKGDGGTLFLVHEMDGRVEGMLILSLQRLYMMLDGLMATDIAFIVTPSGDPRAASDMLRKAKSWCAKAGIKDIYINATTVAGNPERTGRLLKRHGFQPAGTIYRMEAT